LPKPHGAGISSFAGLAAKDARDILRIHTFDNPHGSSEYFIRRLTLKAAGDLADLEMAARFVAVFWQEFQVLALASETEPDSPFASYARQCCLELLDAVEAGGFEQDS
jgi:hypothetical protein